MENMPQCLAATFVNYVSNGDIQQALGPSGRQLVEEKSTSSQKFLRPSFQ